MELISHFAMSKHLRNLLRQLNNGMYKYVTGQDDLIFNTFVRLHRSVLILNSSPSFSKIEKNIFIQLISKESKDTLNHAVNMWKEASISHDPKPLGELTTARTTTRTGIARTMFLSFL